MSSSNQRIGIKEVALEAGVSIATVSRSLRGFRYVSKQTRDRINAAANKLNYVLPERQATFNYGLTNSVGVVAPYVLRWYFAQAIAGAERALREAGLDLLLYNFSQVHGRELLFQDQLLKGRVDSLIVFSLPPTEEEFESLLRLDVPIAVVGFHHDQCSSVAIDDVEGARLAAEHLVKLGHTKIALISGRPVDPFGFRVSGDRREGFLSVLVAHGIEWNSSLEAYGDFSMLGARQAMDELLSRKELPTAVFAMSDEMALGALQAIRRRGLRVPQDISIIGFDDHEMAEFSDLTTIRQPVQALGEAAALSLIERFHSPALTPTSLTLPVELVVRHSTAEPSR